MTTDRRYQSTDLTVDVRGLGGPRGVRLNIEHRSGAALIVPRIDAEPAGEDHRFTITGFDGTGFVVELSEDVAFIRSSHPSPILGGGTRAEVGRAELPPRRAKRVRVTGDEETMPIPVVEE